MADGASDDARSSAIVVERQRLDAAADGLLHGKNAAGWPDYAVGEVRFEKLKAIAKSAPLAHQGVHCDSAERKREIQFHKFTQLKLKRKHGRNSRFADVHSSPLHQAADPRMNFDVNLEFETRLRTTVDEIGNQTRRRLSIFLQFD